MATEKPKILIVDDLPANITVLKGLLKDLDVSLVSAHSGNEALACMLDNDFALVLMDVQMPEMDGYEATRLIRDPQSRVRNHDVPIIAMTAHAMKGDRERCIEAGMDDYIAKPIQPKRLLEIVNILLPASHTDSHAK